MPQSCQDHVLEDPPNRCPIEDVEVYDVLYNDVTYSPPESKSRC